MFDAACEFLKDLIALMPYIFGIYFLFDMIGSLFFGKK